MSGENLCFFFSCLFSYSCCCLTYMHYVRKLDQYTVSHRITGCLLRKLLHISMIYPLSAFRRLLKYATPTPHTFLIPPI
jgi:hypothetical protein